VITVEEYFRKPHSYAQEKAAERLLVAEWLLMLDYRAATGNELETDPDTGCEISGTQGGDGDGGFRMKSSRTGAPGSSHREARAVDRFDPGDKIDTWLDQFEDGKGGNSMLEKHGLYREHPSKTPGWCHLTTRAPGSGHRTFYP